MGGRYFAGKAPDRRSQSSSEDDDDSDVEPREAQPQSRPAEDVASVSVPVTATRGGFGKVAAQPKHVNVPVPDEYGEVHDEDEESAIEDESLRSASEYESEASADSDDEEDDRRRAAMVRPVFRTTSQAEAAAEAALESGVGGNDNGSGPSARAKLERYIQHQQESFAEKARFSNRLEDVDDTDDIDPDAEYQAWRLRELLRIKRDRDALAAREAERDALEARRALPAEQRLAEDVADAERQREEKLAERRVEADAARGGDLGSGANAGPLLQKFHHRGAFYQDEDIVRRKHTGPVEGEPRDRVANLPRSLQRRSVNDVGKRGATRWTHLANEDTSRDSLFDRDSYRQSDRRDHRQT